jgi:ATP-dependent DNA helicase RecQ
MNSHGSSSGIEKILAQYWGHNGFLPQQKQAIEALMRGQDSIVILPTGGGKSLCFQAPAVAMQGLAIVVSPLISLMKDQVDALLECGISAARLDSSLEPHEQEAVMTQIHNQTLKLLYLAPERLISDYFLTLLQSSNLSFIAIDEAHCVSMWGHDFRPEYRQLGQLKKIFPGVTIGAYTATATAPVRKDIAEQLHLDAPEVLVGSFDRPNLIYKVKRRGNKLKQVCQVLERHQGESGVIYCIRRKDVEELCAQLNTKGYRAAPYHAGMKDDLRKQNQDAFINEKVDTIVATVAFGMGIDKSNVRYVIHTAMPKTIEHYQQESGRAGRDGLEAECCLFYSAGDYGTWKNLMRDMPPKSLEIAMTQLSEMYSFCTGCNCRHQAILKYFGQDLQKDNCGACDICLGEVDSVGDALIIAQKTLSCVVRLNEFFGGSYTALVLTGSQDKRIMENRHDELSTYGLLSDYSKPTVHDWIEQLVGQSCLEKVGEYNTLKVTPKGWQVLKGDQTPRLLKPTEKPTRTAKVIEQSWEGVDKELFEALRKMRTKIAGKKSIPAYVVFGDATLREIARHKPDSPQTLLYIKGIGEKKCEQYGNVVLAEIKNHIPKP